MCIFATHANAVVISSPKKSEIQKKKKYVIPRAHVTTLKKVKKRN